MMNLENVKMVEVNDQIRANKCLERIMRVLKQFDCVLEPKVTIARGTTLGEVTVIAIPRKHPLAIDDKDNGAQNKVS